MPLKKILCPIDFSPGSEQAMRIAIRIANEVDAELVLAHVWYLPATAWANAYPLAPNVIDEMIVDDERGLEAAMRAATELGAKRVTSKLLTGPPAAQILETLADAAFDLVVIGTHGRTGLSRILLGSVAEQVVRHAPCSVLVVRPDSKVAPFDHILCPIDFSDSSPAALDLAAELARPGGTGITVLHVIETPVSFSEPLPVNLLGDRARVSTQLLEEEASRLRARTSVPIVVQSRIGSAGSETLASLNDQVFDLVVVGSHGRTGFRRVLLGSVAEKIVRHAGCPVLVARSRKP